MFNFRFYSNQMSQASRQIGAVVFVVGMLLIGFGILIYSLPKLFAILAAMFFFFIGLVCIGFAVRIFIAANRMRPPKNGTDDSQRVNVKIHDGNHID